MHLHILGICGTFMGGIAKLAIEKGFKVTGSDQNCYPPMRDQLRAMGVDLHDGFDAEQLKLNADCVIVGNALSRGTAVIEALLNSHQPFCSGPQWLSESILQDKWVIAVAGTHGKTSTASMVTWILESLGYNPGFLIGGVMENLGVSARLTDSPFFVVEADEYDTAFFDKRSKFVHYRARTCLLTNLEFDHADIFKDLEAIETQFHHLIRTVPQQGLIIRPSKSAALDRVLERGCWTAINNFSTDASLGADWFAKKRVADGGQFEVHCRGEKQGAVSWSLIGEHNVNNALAAIAAANHVGINTIDAIEALGQFRNVKRRMELRGQVATVDVYDDFAHHPTAIKTTLEGLRNKIGHRRLLAVVDLCSNTMKMGVHNERLLESVKAADWFIFHKPKSVRVATVSDDPAQILVKETPEAIVVELLKKVQPGDCVLIMSNGRFGDIHIKFLTKLKQRWGEHGQP